MSFSMASLNLRSRVSKHKHKTPRILRTDPVWMEKLFFFLFLKTIGVSLQQSELQSHWQSFKS